MAGGALPTLPPVSRPRSPARRRAVAVTAALAVLALAGGAATTRMAGRRPARSTHPAPLVRRDLGALADPVRAVTAARSQRDEAVRAVLARRAAAVLQHDERGFLATVDPAGDGFLTRQRQKFQNMAALPFASFTYTLAAGTDPVPLPPDGGAPVYQPQVTLNYRLAGFDPRPVVLHQAFTFVHRGQGWLLAGDAASGVAPGDQELWDFGPVLVRRGQRSLVLGHPRDAAHLAQLADEADRDVPAVTAVWGADWAQRVVVELPADQAELAALVHAPGDLSQLAAVQSTELHPQGAGPPEQSGDRIEINPVPYAGLSPVGRQVVITHEITHVASRPATSAAVPLWLVEGLADYAGFLHAGLATPVVVQELAADVHAHGLPAQLPADADFQPGNPRLAAAYEQAWLACRLIAGRWGQPQLVRLYRALGAGTEQSAEQLSGAFSAVLHLSPAAFTAAWRTEVAAAVGAG